MAHRGLLLSPATAFAVAALFWAVSAVLGWLLRLHPVLPVPGLIYGYVLHAHSHVAFLGWVYNAFFALALHHFVPPARRESYRILFWATQLAVGGMLVTFPLQGYAAASIAFSTLHMVCAAVFVVKIWRQHEATGPARPYLLVSFLGLIVSGLGPLALGPLAALDLRESPAYLLSIYFYLHFQYNGWFVFFPLAVLLQETPTAAAAAPARRALPLLVLGTVMTLALSALWTEPAGWVYGVAVVGGALLLLGSALLLPLLVSFVQGFHHQLARGLAAVGITLWLLKHLLQTLGAFPPVALWGHQRMIVIAFLHLVFLGVVSPLLLAWAQARGWWRPTRVGLAGVAALGSGFVVTQAALFYPTLAAGFQLPSWPALFETMLAGSTLLMIGIVLLLPGLRLR